ncbi:hypothetical protein BDV93DRAFT_85617 [Ceratobasidium sp. AG-I]|nr:hypothetical protein BDV93DRAFT_85617 [Ceratobasidium sp. AG-I]
MPEFTQALANKLVGVPWSIKVTSGPNPSDLETCFFFKYLYDPIDNVSCFMITDTISVWAEVLDTKHTSHRARHAHTTHGKSKRGFALPYHEEDEEAEWRRGVVQTLGDVHAQAVDGVVDVEVRSSEVSDLSIYMSDTGRDFHWRWDVMSARGLSGSILSKQLFMPLVTLAAVTSSLGQSTDDTSEETLITVAERKASTAKVMPAHHLRGFFSRSAIQTTLRCIAQVDAAPSLSSYGTSNKLASTPSVSMSDPPSDHSPRVVEPRSPLPTIWSNQVSHRVREDFMKGAHMTYYIQIV